MTDVLSGDVVGLGRDTFGPWLRAQRERRGIALTTIAEQTKIKRSLLESLERGDLSHWPSASIYRRAHMRDYATVIGLASEPLVAQFVRLFPGPEDAVESSGQDVLDSIEASRLTMTLVVGGTDGFRLQFERARGAIVDLVLVTVSGAAVASVVGAYYYLRIIKIMYFDEPAEAFDPPGLTTGIVMGVSSVLMLVVFIVPAPLVDGAEAAAKALFLG